MQAFPIAIDGEWQENMRGLSMSRKLWLMLSVFMLLVSFVSGSLVRAQDANSSRG